MLPAENTKLIQMYTSTAGVEEKSILHGISKKTRPETLEETQESFRIFKKLFANKKYCMRIDFPYSILKTKEVRKYAALELTKPGKAIFTTENKLRNGLSNTNNHLLYINANAAHK